MTRLAPAQALRRSPREPEAFTDFYRDRYEPIVAYFARRVDQPEVALDLAAESFAQAYIGRRRFRGSTTEEAEGWMYRIAERTLRRYLRRGRLERRAVERLGIELPPVDAERRAQVEELANLAGIRSVLRSELIKLSREQREALRLRIVEDLPYAEVAGRLEISEGAARVRVSRGLKSLADALDANPLIQEMRP